MRRRAEDLYLALPALLVVATALVLAPLEGGYAPSIWYVAGLFLLALVVLVAVVAPPGPAERSPLVTAAVGALALFAVWNLASIAWADDRGAAWEGGNRTVVYTLAAGLLALRPWSRRVGAGAIAAIGIVVALVAVGVLVATSVADRPSDMFLEGRLAEPIDYANATANLWLVGLFPCLWMAIASAARWPQRAAGLAGAALLLQMALLSQSRGALLALVAASVVFLALAPVRAAALLALAVPVALAAAGFDTLTAVRQATSVAAQQDAMADARGTILIACLAAAAAGALAGLLHPRLPAAARGARARRGGDVAVAALALAAVVAAALAVGDPGRWLDDRWADFKTSGYTKVDQGRTRFNGSLGSSRYDFWRVSLDMFRDEPLTGLGADNFAARYLLERRSDESPVHPHSLAFRLLGQLGLVGTALFVAFLAAALAAALRARRRTSDGGREIVAAGLAGFCAWFVHALVDWLWVFPALVLLALALLFVAARVSEDEPLSPERPAGERHPARRLTVAVAGLAALLAAASLAGPGLAARYTAAAYRETAEPELMLARLDRAARLDRLSAEPLIARGILARRLGRADLARDVLLDAIRREPQNWFAHFELALTDGAAGRREEATAAARRASRLNPRQRTVRVLLDALRGDGPIDPDAFEATIVAQQEMRLGPVEAR